MAVKGGNDNTFIYSRLAFEGLATRFGTVTTTAEAGTLNDQCGVVTTNALDATAGNNETIVITNNKATASDYALAFIVGGTTAGTPIITKAVCGSGTITVTIKNDHASTALNGTVIFIYMLIKHVSA